MAEAVAFRDEAMNPTSGKAYRRFNTLWLEMQGYSDPRWMTYKQAAEAGAQGPQGSKVHHDRVLAAERQGESDR